MPHHSSPIPCSPVHEPETFAICLCRLNIERKPLMSSYLSNTGHQFTESDDSSAHSFANTA
jgi:hypothetical protein